MPRLLEAGSLRLYPSLRVWIVHYCIYCKVLHVNAHLCSQNIVWFGSMLYGTHVHFISFSVLLQPLFHFSFPHFYCRHALWITGALVWLQWSQHSFLCHRCSVPLGLKRVDRLSMFWIFVMCSCGIRFVWGMSTTKHCTSPGKRDFNVSFGIRVAKKSLIVSVGLQTVYQIHN